MTASECFLTDSIPERGAPLIQARNLLSEPAPQGTRTRRVIIRIKTKGI